MSVRQKSLKALNNPNVRILDPKFRLLDHNVRLLDPKFRLSDPNVRILDFKFMISDLIVNIYYGLPNRSFAL